jgi:hypothetical protein
MRVEADVEVLMLHLVSSRGGFLTSKIKTFRVQAARVRRPGSGLRFGRLRCLVCGQAVRVRVHSVDETRRRRRRGVIVAVAGGLLVAATVLTIAIYGDTHAGMVPVGGLVTALALLTSYAGAISIVRENGVVIRVRDLDPLHSVVPPYLTGGWRRRDRRIAAPTSFDYED